MKKIILFMFCCVVFSGCNLYNEISDMVYKNRIEKDYIYYSEDFNNLHSLNDIVTYIRNNIEYKQDDFLKDTWSTTEETLKRGYGDCDDFCIVFMNIYYVVFGEKCNFVSVDYDDCREVVEGGLSGHAIVEFPYGYLIDPQNGQIYKGVPIKYRYSFEEFFYF